MKAAYPIIIYPSESGETWHYIEIPDIDRGTQGGSFADCLDMARDALSLWAVTEIDAGREVPPPSELSSIEVPAGAVAMLVDVDFEEYRNTHTEK